MTTQQWLAIIIPTLISLVVLISNAINNNSQSALLKLDKVGQSERIAGLSERLANCERDKVEFRDAIGKLKGQVDMLVSEKAAVMAQLIRVVVEDKEKELKR